MCVVEMRAILRYVTAICPGLLAQVETPLGPEAVVSTPSPPRTYWDQTGVLGQGTPLQAWCLRVNANNYGLGSKAVKTK